MGYKIEIKEGHHVVDMQPNEEPSEAYSDYLITGDPDKFVSDMRGVLER